MKRRCPVCRCNKLDKGRALTGRRAYRCKLCGNTWTAGTQGRKAKFSAQRQGTQFHDTGACKQERFDDPNGLLRISKQRRVE